MVLPIAKAIQIRSKIIPSINQNSLVSAATSGIIASAVIIPITAHNPPRIPEIHADAAMILPSLNLPIKPR
jgi:hypothetical protein